MKIVCIVIILCLLLFGILLLLPRVNIANADSGSIIYTNEGLSISCSLSSVDLNSIIKIFDNRMLYSDNPSCGFSEKIAIHIQGDQKFYIAHDGCPIIYSKNHNKYFRLSKSEHQELLDILEKYGVIIPSI